MTDKDKLSKAEEDLLFLFKDSPCPLLDIVDNHIAQERILAKRRSKPMVTKMHVVLPVFKELRREYLIAKSLLLVPDSVLLLDREGYLVFHGITLVPFFSTDRAEGMLPHCSLLMIYQDGEFRGL